MLDKNTSPYYDDYNEDKKYVQIMVRPGVPIQARELSQMQSTLQKQIERFGRHVFKEGSMVIPGNIGVDLKLDYLKLEAVYESVAIDITKFANKKVIGRTSGAIAIVKHIEPVLGGDPNTLYFKYETGDSLLNLSGTFSSGSATITSLTIDALANLKQGSVVSGVGIPANTYIKQINSSSSITLSNAVTSSGTISFTSKTSSKFIDDEIVTTIEGDLITQPFNAKSFVTDATGQAASVMIERGVYFVSGYFCLVDSQFIILDKYTNTPSYKVGLLISDSFVTAEEDSSLNDPATGSTNFNAPGADRYKIQLDITKVALDDTTDTSFIELVRLSNGEIQKLASVPAYSELEKTLARRTFDESGNYTVKYFPLEIKEHLNDGSNGGVYTASNGGDESKLVLSVGTGKAYVKGFEIENISTININLDKARDTRTLNNSVSYLSFGTYTRIDNVSGLPNINAYNSVTLTNASSTTIGTAKVFNYQYITGTIGTTAATYNLYMFDIDMGGNDFADVRNIVGSSFTAKTALIESKAVLFGSESQSPILTFDEYAIKNISDEVYSVRRYLNGTMTGNSLTLTSGTNEIFAAGNSINYIVAIDTPSATATSNGLTSGKIVNMGAVGNSITLGGSPIGRQVTFTIPSAAGSSLKIIGTVTKQVGSVKTKTLTTRTSTVAHASTIILDRADIYRIVSITDATTSQNITTRYNLDNGQRDLYYDRGSLTFDTSFSAPAGNVTIVYEYFEHGVGDYFSVNSYDGIIDYKDVPFYVSKTTGTLYDLLSSIDFRPRISNDGTTFSVTSEFPPSDSAFTCDYESYIPRIDKLYVDKYGKFNVIQGSSGVNPQPPKDPDDAMVLYQLNLNPYTFGPSDVSKKYIDNRNYTMRDIGRLEKRIDNIEYYTALSLLEKETSDLFIDDGTGVNRFKNGFVVDNFKSHKVGDVSLKNYRCSIDVSKGLLRPQFDSKNVGLDLDTVNSTGYRKTGSLITLPYTEVSYINQPYASTTSNINPYNVFSWLGQVVCTPPSDDWYETARVADQVIETDDGRANALAALNGQVIWGNWETNWVGQEISRVRDTSAGYSGSANLIYEQHVSRAIAAAGGIAGVQSVTDEVRVGGGYFSSNVTYREIVSRQVGQIKTGVQTTVVPTVTNEVIDDRIVDSSVIPYMREVLIDYHITNLKPNTVIYPFFDGVLMSAYATPLGGTLGGTITTNAAGEARGTLLIPSNDQIKFTTGSKLLRFIDNQANASLDATTVAEYVFKAIGILETRQSTVLSTRSAEVVYSTIVDQRVSVGNFTEQSTARVTYYDPLAQTFLVDNPGGIFLSKINIYFQSKDSRGIPVQLQIRNVVNGYPGQLIVPFSHVTKKPSDVSLSTDGSVATSFVFDSPVYLQDGQEYCIVLLANSGEYNVFISEFGQMDILTDEYITQQPYAGSLFKSQNTTTWTAFQEQDLKFEMFRCSFTTGVNGNVVLKNKPTSLVPLVSNPFYITPGSGISTVIVYHPNHSLTTGKKVVISGVSGTHAGIAASALNGEHTITYVDFNRYSFTVSTVATSTGSTGGNGIYATHSVKVDTSNLSIQTLMLPETELYFGIKTKALNTGTLATTPAAIELLTNTNFQTSQIIESSANTSTSDFIVNATLATTNNAISPVIDTGRMSIIAVSNIINNSTTNETNAYDGDALARYITKNITLSNPSNAVRVYFSSIRPVKSEIEVYVKTLAVDNTTESFDVQPYVLMDKIQYPVGSSTANKEYVFEKDSIADFGVFSVKIVMKTSDTAEVPVISDLRCIALGT